MKFSDFILVMKRIFLLLFSLLLSIYSVSQMNLYERELRNLFDISLLPSYCSGDMYQISSYDRTGGNNDGFSGQYSYIRKEGENLVMADLKGPGIVNRIWTPTPTKDTIQFYFDGEKFPRISIPFIDLFSGRLFPFLAPLCGNELGGYYCYLPIPYRKSLKIVYKGTNLKFHQIQYRQLEEKDKIDSFSWHYFDDNPILSKIDEVWDASPLALYGNQLKVSQVSMTIKGGEEKDFFSLLQGGRIVGLEIDSNNNLKSKFDRILLKANWDEESECAMEVPLNLFFGYVWNESSMHSMLLGEKASMCYSYIPMPFDRKARLRLKYEEEEETDEITISGRVYYLTEKRDSLREGKFYAQTRREYLPPVGTPYIIADIHGKGHYIGTLLRAQGLDEGMTEFWEGDDCIFVDGEMRMHGTGSEDYFNGGWYAVADRWDRGISLPIHGSLLYDLKTSRTGGYRFYLNDKINFNSSCLLNIEHGPEGNKLDVDYASIGLFYSDAPSFENRYIFDISEKNILRRDILFPQEMQMRLYWSAQAMFDNESMIVKAQAGNHWALNIDFEAVPMVQMDLTGLDNGKYRIYVVHSGLGEKNSPFSIWQRTNQLSDWIISKEYSQTTSYVGEMEISEQIKTLTIRRKKDENAIVKIDYFIFEKIKE